MRPNCRPVLFVLAALAGGCQKAEFDAAKPAAITLSVSTTLVDADDGTIDVSATLLDDQAVPILGRDLTFSLAPPSGSTAPADQVIATDEQTGIAFASFSGVSAAGTWTATATIGAGETLISGEAAFDVVAGAPATLDFSLAVQTLVAGSSAGWSHAVADAAGNPITDLPILVAPTNGGVGVSLDTPSTLRFERTGTFTVLATIAGSSISRTDDLTVTPAAAAQVTTTLSRSGLGTLETLEVRCAEYDAYGNATGGTFTTGNVATAPASTIASTATSGVFTASGFTTVGEYTATCTRSSNSDVEDFAVVSQTATNTLLATASKTLVDAGTTLTVNCKELDTYGNVLPTAAGSFTVTFPTQPAGNTATHDSGAGDASAANGIDFVIGGAQSLARLGEYTARCERTGLAAMDSESFVVADVTPPVIVSAPITAATLSPGAPPNGVTADNHYAPGSTLTVEVTATDFVGVRTVESSVVSGSGTAGEVDLYPTTGSSSNVTTTVAASVDAGGETLTSISYRVTVSDRSGNSTSFDLPSVRVDPAVAFSVAPGVTIRTWSEQAAGPEVAVAIGTSGSSLVLQKESLTGGDMTGVMRLTGATAPATLSTAGSGTFGTSSRTILGTSVGFQTRNYFYGILATPQIGTLDGANLHETFSNNLATLPLDIALGTVGANRLFYLDGVTDIHKVETGSSAAISYLSTPGVDMRSLVKDPGAARLLAADADGRIHAITDSAGSGMLITVPLTPGPLPASCAKDIAVVNGKILVVGCGTSLYRVNGAAVESDAVTSFANAYGVTGIGTAAYVLDADLGTGFWRVYKVTGF